MSDTDTDKPVEDPKAAIDKAATAQSKAKPAKSTKPSVSDLVSDEHRDTFSHMPKMTKEEPELSPGNFRAVVRTLTHPFTKEVFYVDRETVVREMTGWVITQHKAGLLERIAN